jgi:hypothetical protein
MVFQGREKSESLLAAHARRHAANNLQPAV